MDRQETENFGKMSSNPSEDESRERSAAQFATTHWSTVLAAEHANTCWNADKQKQDRKEQQR